MRTVLGAIWTNRQIPKTFWLNSSSFIPGKDVGLESARADWVVVVILVGIGSGDSRIETAAVEGILGDAEDEPLTMTCRFVDLRAERRLDGGAEAISGGLGPTVWTYSCL